MLRSPWKGKIEEISWVKREQWRWEHERSGWGWMETNSIERDDKKGGTFWSQVENWCKENSQESRKKTLAKTLINSRYGA